MSSRTKLLCVGGSWDGEAVWNDGTLYNSLPERIPAPVIPSDLVPHVTTIRNELYKRHVLQTPDGSIAFLAPKEWSTLEALQHLLKP